MMDLGGVSRILFRNLLIRSATLQVNQQCRCYLPYKLPDNMKKRLDRHRKPFIPGETTSEEFLQDWQKEPEKVAEYKRLAWAKFGSASGVDISSILPTKKDLEEEWEAEKRWWPTLENMKNRMKMKQEQHAAKKAAYEKRVAENMAKMPKWIAEWEDQQTKDANRELAKAEQYQQNMEMALEKMNYKLDPSSMEFKKLFKEQQLQDKLAKKKLQKA
ncbi:large ribosomal subunit protein mL64-like [Styela clava]